LTNNDDHTQDGVIKNIMIQIMTNIIKEQLRIKEVILKKDKKSK
jgi:hypothetical protein